MWDLTLSDSNPEDEGDMKLIIAIINPLKLDDVREALTPLGVQDLTVTEVKGFGGKRANRDLPRRGIPRGLPAEGEDEVVVPSDIAEQVDQRDHQVGPTGKIGDDKIFIGRRAPMRIRTGETDTAAL